MHTGKLVFAQLMKHLPLTTFRRSVARYRGHHKVQRFSCLDQYLSMAFAQVTYRESLRDIEACLRAQASKLYHLGIRSTVARNTLARWQVARDQRARRADYRTGRFLRHGPRLHRFRAIGTTQRGRQFLSV